MTQTKKILLIDIENIPSQIKKLEQNLEEYYKVIICYATSSANIAIDLLDFVCEAKNQNRLEIIKMQVKGKNAADFGLAFYAGKLMQEFKEIEEFVIFSKDKDLDNVINLLRDNNKLAMRIDEKNELKNEDENKIDKLNKIKNLNNIRIINLQTYCNKLKAMTKPSKLEALENDLKNFCKSKPNLAGQILQQLKDEKIIEVIQGKVKYNV